METFLTVGFHVSDCSSSGKVLLSSYIRSPIIHLLLQQRFTVAYKKGRRNFLSLSSSRRGKETEMIGKKAIFFPLRSSFISTINNGKTTNNSLIHPGIKRDPHHFTSCRLQPITFRSDTSVGGPRIFAWASFWKPFLVQIHQKAESSKLTSAVPSQGLNSLT